MYHVHKGVSSDILHNLKFSQYKGKINDLESNSQMLLILTWECINEVIIITATIQKNVYISIDISEIGVVDNSQ